MKILKRGNIKVNRAKCLKCNQILESNGSHVFQSCQCGNVSIDGEKGCIRHQWYDEDNYQNLSEYFDDEESDHV